MLDLVRYVSCKCQVPCSYKPDLYLPDYLPLKNLNKYKSPNQPSDRHILKTFSLSLKAHSLWVTLYNTWCCILVKKIFNSQISPTYNLIPPPPSSSIPKSLGFSQEVSPEVERWYYRLRHYYAQISAAWLLRGWSQERAVIWIKLWLQSRFSYMCGIMVCTMGINYSQIAGVTLFISPFTYRDCRRSFQCSSTYRVPYPIHNGTF